MFNLLIFLTFLIFDTIILISVNNTNEGNDFLLLFYLISMNKHVCVSDVQDNGQVIIKYQGVKEFHMLTRIGCL